MYIPTGQNLFCYDVNYLYPFVMLEHKYPVGQISEFFGDISILEDKYWIAEASVRTKRDLRHPYLQIHHSIDGNKSRLRTISPNGCFNMKIHKPEYVNALKDYDIIIKEGYYFEEGDIFSKFVLDLYTLRKTYVKSHPLNLTCKLLMNSLYGRFGMKPITTTQKFVDRKTFLKLTQEYNEIDFIDLDKYGLFVTYEDPKKINSDHKVSVGIASAVTAFSRVHMTKFKNRLDFNLYYSDTDSIFIDIWLYRKYVGSEIGQFKLEYALKEAVFLGPKIYAGITTDDKYINKIKGFKNSKSVDFNDLKSLLHKNSKGLDLQHQKWFRSLSEESIQIQDQVYHLMTTENKRIFMYDDKGIANNTKAITVTSVFNK